MIPIGPDKRPLIECKEYQTRQSTCEEIVEWQQKFPDMQIGIVTGKVSNLTVVDMEKDADLTLLKDETLSVRTGGGGKHLYFTYDESFTNAVRVLPNIDIRSEGGYVVTWPSVSSKGKYELLQNFPILKMSDETKKLLQTKTRKRAKRISQVIEVKEGGRNDALASFIGTMLRNTPEKQWLTDVFPAAIAINKTYHPPIPESEVFEVFNSICDSETKKREGAIDLLKDPSEDIIKETFKSNAKKATMALAKYLVDKYKIITVGEKVRELYAYRDGKYIRGEEAVVLPEIQRILGEHTNKNAKGETMHKIMDQTFSDRSIFDTAPRNFIPVKNGVFDVENKKLLPHSHEYHFLFQFPVEYNPEADCPNIKDFMRQVLDPKDIPILEEWLGYFFYRKYTFKKSLIMVGEKDTGKTTLLETIIKMIGYENTASVTLQKITYDRFSAVSLYGKHANLVDDLSSGDVKETGNFKMVCGGGSIPAEYKFGNMFMFKNFAKLTYACNRIPEIKDHDDDAYYSRWLVVQFKNKIEKKIKNMDERLGTPLEISGLFNLAMDGLRRLLEQGEFSNPTDADVTRNIMMLNSSSIAHFVATKLYRQPDSEVTKDEMYDHYVKHCNDNELPTATKDMFGKRLLIYAGFASDGISFIDRHTSKRIWRGAGIRGIEVKKINESDKVNWEGL